MLCFLLFETHGIILLEEISPNEAAAILRKYGAKTEDLKTKESRKAWFRKILQTYHPDRTGGDKAKEEITKAINSAYDVIKALPDSYFDRTNSFTNNPGYASPSRREPERNAPWQTDPRAMNSQIYREDYRDMHFFMKHMWELSGHSREKYRIQAYDGAYFRSSITVFGSEKIFEEMAKAMIVFNSHGGNPYKTEAVFVNKESSNELKLIYLKPYFFTKPYVFKEGEDEDFEGQPYNDQRFMRRLPEILRDIKQEYQNELSESDLKKVKNYEFETRNGISKMLDGLVAEAIKAPTFEDFKKDFLIQLKHGTYWHITDNPNFQIDPTKGPRDMSSLAGQNKYSPGKLMVTSHLNWWKDYYGKSRPYAALIDLSDVPRKDYYQVNRGFGNEFFIENPSKAKVLRVVPIKQAQSIDAVRKRFLPKNEEELKAFYELANSNKGKY